MLTKEEKKEYSILEDLYKCNKKWLHKKDRLRLKELKERKMKQREGGS